MENSPKFLQSLRNPRSRLLIFAFLAVVVVFLLATGLSGLELLPGDSGAFGWAMDSLETGGGGAIAGDTFLKVVRVVYIVALVLFPVWIVYMIVNPKARKQFLRDILVVGTFIMILLFFTSKLSEMSKDVEDVPLGQFGGAQDLTLPDTGTFDPNAAPPESIVWITTLAVALVIVVILVLAVLIILRSRRREESAVDRIALEVQSALDDLQSGGDLRNVVVRCYSEMVQTLKKERNIQRSGSLTPREFEESLYTLGFPNRPVSELTRLFESVRYGRKDITRREELIAVDSLSAILDACRRRA